MKSRVINRSKVIEAFILEPCESDAENPYSITHGWQVVFVVGYDQNYPIQVIIDKESEKECIELVNELDFLKV
jgi:hypothetical protein